MEFFSTFPLIPYSFDPANNDFQYVVNIFARCKFLDSVIANTLVYYPYAVQDGDTPWSIADKYYGDPKRHWIVMFANKIVDPYFDWPMTQNDLNSNIVQQYGSLANAQATLDHVEQQTQISSSLMGVITIVWANTTLNAAYTYSFSTSQLSNQTLPNIAIPSIPVSTTTYTAPDGSIVTQNTNLVAISAYNQIQNTNEAKRIIQLLDKQYVTIVENELQSLLAQ